MHTLEQKRPFKEKHLCKKKIVRPSYEVMIFQTLTVPACYGVLGQVSQVNYYKLF